MTSKGEFPNSRKVIELEAYCVKCRVKREIQGAENVTLKNGKPAVTGNCGTCGTKMFRMTKAG